MCVCDRQVIVVVQIKKIAVAHTRLCITRRIKNPRRYIDAGTIAKAATILNKRQRFFMINIGYSA